LILGSLSKTAAARLGAPRGAGPAPAGLDDAAGIACARVRRPASTIRAHSDDGRFFDRLPAVLITVEGVDGAGKTTLARSLGERLGVEVLREPGGVEVSERIRALVQDPALPVDPRAEALLYAAARAQLVAERVRPALDAGRTVVLDRFVDSSLAYQGGGRGLEVRAINDFATGGLRPDVTLLLKLDPGQARARKHGIPDRLESEPDAFFEAVARAYDELAAAEPDRFRVLDASLPPDEVLRAALHALGET
jgi:dTMP kinase